MKGVTLNDVHDLMAGATAGIGCEMRWVPPEKLDQVAGLTAAEIAEEVDRTAAENIALAHAALARLRRAGIHGSRPTRLILDAIDLHAVASRHRR